MKPITTLTLTVLISLALLPHGAALHCNGNIITIDAGVETIYLDDRSDEADDYDRWTYLETNGIEGLQSGGAWCVTPECYPVVFADGCNHIDPDQLII